MSYRNAGGWKRALIVRGYHHELSDPECHALRDALGILAAQANPARRRVATGLLHVLGTGLAPNEDEELSAWRAEARAEPADGDTDVEDEIDAYLAARPAERGAP